MKLVSRKIGLILRLGVLATALLLGQQAMAVGTRADTQILNTATVDFEVAGVPQAQLSATAEFVVDRRVDFTLIATIPGALAPVTPGGPAPGDPDYFVEFTLANTSNSVLDFFIDLNQMIGFIVGGSGLTDNADMAVVDFAVSTDSVLGTNPPPARGGPQFVDELAADDSIRIRVYGDPSNLMTNGQIAGVQLDVNAREGGAAGLGAVLVDTTDDPLLVDNVFANAAGGNLEIIQDGFIVVSAELSVVKSFLISNDPLGAGLPIPGVTMEYSIAISNANAITAATAVSISDLISPNVAFVFDAYGAPASGDDVRLVDGVGTTICSADANDGDNDGCGIFAPGSTLIVDGNGALSVGVIDTLTISFQVLIPDPATTP